MNLYSKNILQDIANEIKQYTNKGKAPTYIIVSNADSPKLLNEMSRQNCCQIIKNQRS